MTRDDPSRRRFCKTGIAVALLPLAAGTLLGEAGAQELPHVDPNDPTAQALKYTHDAASVDAATRGGADRHCASCRFYTDPEAKPWGPCSIFPGKAVNAQGWCNAWVAKA
ncbi:MAG: high-potential iron-sulfur protein [Gammaproteobacteria bacterium]|nr:high-potential iron-sulfur protein [Gammaproteobacteria bacterium]